MIRSAAILFSKMPSNSSHHLLSMILRRFFLACVLLLPVHSWAVAMGDVVVRSALGQLLDADIDFSVLSAQEAESLSVRLAPADMFAEAGL